MVPLYNPREGNREIVIDSGSETSEETLVNSDDEIECYCDCNSKIKHLQQQVDKLIEEVRILRSNTDPLRMISYGHNVNRVYTVLN